MKPAIGFDDAALQKLLLYHYPGNVRELQYTIERAIIMSDGEVLHPKDLILLTHRIVPITVTEHG